MKDEIKEILDKLEIVARKHTIELCEDGSKIETMSASVIDELRLNNYSANLLLDYITNLQTTLKGTTYCFDEEEHKRLQEENERLKAINTEYERLNKENGRGFTITNVETYDINQLLDYKSRCEKAIEYIKTKKAIINTDYIRIFDLFEIEEQGYTDTLLNILQDKEVIKNECD